MGTRAVYTFSDERGTHHVYSHWDNYPSGASEKLHAMFDSQKVWKIPRFEADEFAAGFIAQHKNHDGDFRLTNSPEKHIDLEYWYEVFQAKNGQLIVKAWTVDNWYNQFEKSLVYYGRVKDFTGEEE